MQVLPPAAALEGPTAHQWAQPLGAEECADAADGPDAWAAPGPRPGAHSGMSPPTHSTHFSMTCFPHNIPCLVSSSLYS